VKVWQRALTLLFAVAMLFGVTVGPGAAPSSAVDLATARVDMKLLLVAEGSTAPSLGA